jgi:hypothetical protein
MWRQFVSLLLMLGNLWLSEGAVAATLQQRMAAFPHWSLATGLQKTGELCYPSWFTGEWTATSILREQVAPLSPDIITPGFDRNRANIDRPYDFKVRFGSTSTTVAPGIIVNRDSQMVDRAICIKADRTFNGEQIANAYLGVNAVKSIQTIDQPQVVQVTKLQNGTELRSTVTGYLSEAGGLNEFITTEIDQQVFQGTTTYLNTVETTTSYRLVSKHHILADQVTAIYLSPQDPEYFRALQQPVAVYRYTLELI